MTDAHIDHFFHIFPWFGSKLQFCFLAEFSINAHNSNKYKKKNSSQFTKRKHQFIPKTNRKRLCNYQHLSQQTSEACRHTHLFGSPCLVDAGCTLNYSVCILCSPLSTVNWSGHTATQSRAYIWEQRGKQTTKKWSLNHKGVVGGRGIQSTNEERAGAHRTRQNSLSRQHRGNREDSHLPVTCMAKTHTYCIFHTIGHTRL